MITVRFVKRFLAVFFGYIILVFLLPAGFGGILFHGLLITGILAVVVLKHGFPQTQVIVDETTIHFKREFPSWYFLKNYYLHDLVISHKEWNNWVKIRLSDREGSIQNFYLFFMDVKLCFAAETTENNDLEFWVQTKFPERSLQTANSFRKYRDKYDTLKEKQRMRVF
ncbi:hypothetical protein [uncultured Fluviicola sp.]|uniref:hypothetical protein n=1 Tax=uncultured Fluviicola sp. TaxID=463303 RepID=UPI0025F3477E|nr:hypothetical protein [uncultured Fluviicola sp.]